MLARQQGIEATLQAIVHAAASTVPGAEHASVCRPTGPHRARTAAATGELAERLDLTQLETGQGPGLDALADRRAVLVPDVRRDPRWPVFASPAAALGAGSMLAVRLNVDAEVLGALTVTSTRPGGLDEESERVALPFAAHAAVALAGAERDGRLVQAMGTRDLIGQAKGILVERLKVTGDQAFALLVRSSQASNRKLRDVAEDLVRSGELPRG